LRAKRLHAHGFFAVPPPFMVAGPFGTAAKYLGLTPAQLMQDLSAKKSLADIAKAKGKSVTGLEQAMLAPTKSVLDKAVKAGQMTTAQEQRLLRGLSVVIARRVNSTGVVLGPGFHARFGAGPPGSFWSRRLHSPPIPVPAVP
jgi:hypothetical protein